MKLNFLPNMHRFIENLGREFGSSYVGEIIITLSPKLYDYAWREIVQFGTPSSVDGLPPKQVEWWHCGVKATLKQAEASDNG